MQFSEKISEVLLSSYNTFRYIYFVLLHLVIEDF